MAAVKLLTFKAAVAAAAIGLLLATCLEARNTPWRWQTKNLPLRRRHTRLNANGIEKEMNSSFYEIPRGGGESTKLDDDDFSTDYYDNVEEEYESDEQSQEEEEEEEEESFGHPYEMEGRRPYQNVKQRKEENTVVFKRAKSLLQKSALVTANVASASLKQSGKAAYYLATPKYVKESELYGVWRLDQQLMEDDSFCSATIEFTSHHQVIWGTTTDRISTFRFTRRSWPRSCHIEFEAPIFRYEDGDDSKPIIWMRYKGYFRRKIADPTVVKMIGTIYPIKKKRRGLFGRAQQPTNNSGRIGTFTGRRRISLPFHNDSPPQEDVHNNNDIDVEEYNDPYDEYDDGIDE